MKYKAVLFDLFGTLVDNFNRDEYVAVLAEMASVVKVPPKEFQRLWLDAFTERNTGVHPNPQYSIRYICEKLNIDIDDNMVEKAASIRLDYTLRSLKPRPDAIVTLKKLQSLRLKTGLISDCTGDIPMVWEETEFAGVFDATVFSCEVLTKKPDPEIYRITIRRLDVQPQDCIFVGDGGSGELTGAREMGMFPVLIRDPDEGEYQFVEREEDWEGPRISYLREVLNLVK
jgi:putative hydrolase of the HAD superfamily